MLARVHAPKISVMMTRCYGASAIDNEEIGRMTVVRKSQG
jgi:hypothetical protein